MSVPESTPLAGIDTEPLPALQAAADVAARSVRFVAFWVATLLPFAYLPLLATGMVTTHGASFAGLLCLNAVAFVVGHSHNRPD
jgi:ABC-type anion transport system duplicated permease subunit